MLDDPATWTVSGQSRGRGIHLERRRTEPFWCTKGVNATALVRENGIDDLLSDASAIDATVALVSVEGRYYSPSWRRLPAKYELMGPGESNDNPG